MNKMSLGQKTKFGDFYHHWRDTFFKPFGANTNISGKMLFNDFNDISNINYKLPSYYNRI